MCPVFSLRQFGRESLECRFRIFFSMSSFCVFFFFFSSRRRHTRCLSDWSSDVCSSDLVRAVHRIDKETSGLVVFARTAAAETHLGGQFRAHATERLYLALVRGRPPEDRKSVV